MYYTIYIVFSAAFPVYCAWDVGYATSHNLIGLRGPL
jgi:hypothetical protein